MKKTLLILALVLILITGCNAQKKEENIVTSTSINSTEVSTTENTITTKEQTTEETLTEKITTQATTETPTTAVPVATEPETTIPVEIETTTVEEITTQKIIEHSSVPEGKKISIGLKTTKMPKKYKENLDKILKRAKSGSKKSVQIKMPEKDFNEFCDYLKNNENFAYLYLFDYHEENLLCTYAWGTTGDFDRLENINKNSEYKRTLEALVEQIGLNNNTSEKEAVIKIHNYICESYNYDYSLNYEANKNNPYAEAYHPYALTQRKLGVCNAYAELFRILCRYCNIECYTVFGNASDGNGNYGYHAWNKVVIDGQEYYVDTTFDDGNTSYNTAYLLCSESQISDRIVEEIK